MNRQEFEQMLVSDLIDGHTYDITKYIAPKDLEEELAELMFTWSTFQSDPVKLQGAMQRHLVGLINRIVEEKNLPEYEPTEEDEYMRFLDHVHQERKDRRAERES